MKERLKKKIETKSTKQKINLKHKRQGMGDLARPGEAIGPFKLCA